MAIPFHTTTPFCNSLSPKRITTAHPSTLVFSKPSHYPNPNLHLPRRGRKNSNNVSLSTRSRIVVTTAAVSGTKSSVSEDASNSLDRVEVLDLNGNTFPISDLWKDRKAVVAFARHFGCVLCRKRADYLVSSKDQMDACGVALILIGPGTVDQAKAFSEQTKFKGEVYADPSHSAYEALEFVSGVFTTFTPGAGLKIIQSYMEGYRQDWKLSSEKETVSRGGWSCYSTVNDQRAAGPEKVNFSAFAHRQQGGIIVAGPGKRSISYIHKDKEAGDDPEIADILNACCS